MQLLCILRYSYSVTTLSLPLPFPLSLFPSSTPHITTFLYWKAISLVLWNVPHSRVGRLLPFSGI